MNRRPAAAAAALLACGLLLSACGSDSEPEAPAQSQAESPAQSPAQSPTASSAAPSPAGTTIDVTIRGDEISPNAEKVKVKRGEQVTLDIVSDRDGEFHVHSTPEHEIAFKPGRTTSTLSFDRPGLIDVEEHESHKLLVQFEVR